VAEFTDRLAQMEADREADIKARAFDEGYASAVNDRVGCC
jgi:hypothetical protein